jgi:hypothetical protein
MKFLISILILNVTLSLARLSKKKGEKLINEECELKGDDCKAKRFACYVSKREQAKNISKGICLIYGEKPPTDGFGCNLNRECITHNCDKTEKMCRPVYEQDGTTLKFIYLEAGEACYQNSQCENEMCNNSKCGKVPKEECANSKDCQSRNCVKEGETKICLIRPGDSCEVNKHDQCQNKKCVSGKCSLSKTGERCKHSSHCADNGRCSEDKCVKRTGQSCTKTDECDKDHQCNSGKCLKKAQIECKESEECISQNCVTRKEKKLCLVKEEGDCTFNEDCENGDCSEIFTCRKKVEKITTKPTKNTGKITPQVGVWMTSIKK